MKLQRCKAWLLALLIATSISFSPEISFAGRSYTPVIRTTSGTEPAGIRMSTWVFSSNFVGTVNGVSMVAGSALDIDAPPGELLNSIPYTITAGSITIYKIL